MLKVSPPLYMVVNRYWLQIRLKFKLALITDSPVRTVFPVVPGTACPICENEIAGSKIFLLCCSDPRVYGAAPASVFRSGVTCDGSYGWGSNGAVTPRDAPIGGLFPYPPLGLVSRGWSGALGSIGDVSCF